MYSELETGLKYRGCTGIEDELQYGVPETIYNLLRADMRVWMLTGDKLVRQVRRAGDRDFDRPIMSTYRAHDNRAGPA